MSNHTSAVAYDDKQNGSVNVDQCIWEGVSFICMRNRTSAVAYNKSRNVSSCTQTAAGWEGVMRVRCSKGLSISQFHGHFFVRSIDLLSLPQVSGPSAAPLPTAVERRDVIYC